MPDVDMSDAVQANKDDKGMQIVEELDTYLDPTRESYRTEDGSIISIDTDPLHLGKVAPEQVEYHVNPADEIPSPVIVMASEEVIARTLTLDETPRSIFQGHPAHSKYIVWAETAGDILIGFDRNANPAANNMVPVPATPLEIETTQSLVACAAPGQATAVLYVLSLSALSSLH